MHQKQCPKGDSPTELQLSLGGQYDAEDYYSLQKQKVMQQHIYYTKYALQFADMQIPELVTVFNRQVGKLQGILCVINVLLHNFLFLK